MLYIFDHERVEEFDCSQDVGAVGSRERSERNLLNGSTDNLFSDPAYLQQIAPNKTGRIFMLTS
jgi:hypothetical protein